MSTQVGSVRTRLHTAHTERCVHQNMHGGHVHRALSGPHTHPPPRKGLRFCSFREYVSQSKAEMTEKEPPGSEGRGIWHLPGGLLLTPCRTAATRLTQAQRRPLGLKGQAGSRQAPLPVTHRKGSGENRFCSQALALTIACSQARGRRCPPHHWGAGWERAHGHQVGDPTPTQGEGSRKCGGKGACDRLTMAFWPQAQGCTWKKGSLISRANSPPPSSKDSQGSKFSFNPKCQGFDSDGKISGPTMKRGWSVFHPIREPTKLLSGSPFYLVPPSPTPQKGALHILEPKELA